MRRLIIELDSLKTRAQEIDLLISIFHYANDKLPSDVVLNISFDNRGDEEK